MTKRRVVFFNVDEVSVAVEVEDAAVLSDRLHQLSGGNLEHPAYSASVLVDRAIEGETVKSPEWHVPEANALRQVIDDWLHEVKVDSMPEAVMTLRYALFGEWQDALPGGLYHFLLDLGNMERDAILELERAPVHGQAMTIEGKTYIVRRVTAAPGSEYVAVVTAELHPD